MCVINSAMIPLIFDVSTTVPPNHVDDKECYSAYPYLTKKMTNHKAINVSPTAMVFL